jgi:hypothetical protein
LGFSKGSTQADIYKEGKFEEVAFGGPARDRLDNVLKRVGLIPDTGHVTAEIENPNSDFSFGSLVRCSLTRETDKGTHASSGELILKSFREVSDVLDTCMEQYLTNLPKCTKLVLLLGVTDKYIDNCYEKIKRLYPSVTRINSVSYGDSDRVFLHLTHPSPLNGHLSNWKAGNHKFEDAVEVCKSFTVTNVERRPNSNIITKVAPALSKRARESSAKLIDATMPVGGEKADTVAYIPIGRGAIDNDYVKLTSCKHLFSPDIIGGSNKKSLAIKEFTLECEGVGSTWSDIDGTKWLFRARKHMRMFYKQQKAKPGDSVKITKINDLHFKLQLIKS